MPQVLKDCSSYAIDFPSIVLINLSIMLFFFDSTIFGIIILVSLFFL